MNFYRDYTSPPHPAAFSGVRAASDFFNLSEKEVKKRLEDVEAYSRLKEVRKVKRYNPFIVRQRLEVLQLDLLDISSKELVSANEGVKYILMIIDTFSRKAWGVLLSEKKADTVTDAFRSFLLRDLSERDRRRVQRVVCDKGGEFASKDFRGLLKKFKIVMKHPNKHAPHVERFNRTFQKILYSYLIEHRTVRYLEKLPVFFQSYNGRIHSAHGLTPDEAFKKENSFRVNQALERRFVENWPARKKDKQVFEIGDTVRIMKGVLKANAFQRSYKDTYSVQVYTVSGIVKSNLPLLMYKLSDIKGEELDGFFYAKQLVRVTPKDSLFHVEKVLERRTGADGKVQVKVQWLGYKKKYDSWIDEEDLSVYT